MKNGTPHKPTLLWDGNCRFCRRWILRWQKLTGEQVDYRPCQEALQDFPQLSPGDCERSVFLILPDGQTFSAAHAVFQSLALAGKYPFLLRWYEKSALFRKLSEFTYSLVAGNRGWLPRF